MNRPDVTAVLNRLLRMLCRSLPIYLQGTQPWTRRGAEKGLQVLAQIAADQQALAQRVAEAVHQQDGHTDTGQFPIQWTAIHDLDLEFLIRKAIEYQRRDVAETARCVDELAGTPPLESLAEEILATARRHLEMLEELITDEQFTGR